MLLDVSGCFWMLLDASGCFWVLLKSSGHVWKKKKRKKNGFRNYRGSIWGDNIMGIHFSKKKCGQEVAINGNLRFRFFENRIEIFFSKRDQQWRELFFGRFVLKQKKSPDQFRGSYSSNKKIHSSPYPWVSECTGFSRFGCNFRETCPIEPKLYSFKPP